MTTIIDTLQAVAVALFGGTLDETTVTGAIPTFWNWLTGEQVLPFFLIGVGVSLLMLAVRIVKSIFWGV